MFPFDYFADPRFRQDRIRNVTFYVIGLGLLGALLGLLIWQQKKTEAQGRKLAAAPAREIVTLEKATPEVRRPLLEIEEPETKAPQTTPTPPPGSLGSLISQAQSAYVSGDREKARALMAKVDLNNANSPLGWEMAGLLQADAGKTQEAEEIYSKGILATPSASLHYRRALLLRDKGLYDNALADFEKAVELSPRDIVISNERYLLLVQMGREAQVRKEITDELSSGVASKKNAWIMGLCGVALENGQYQEAAAMLDYARNALNPGTFHELLNNPVLLRYQNRPEIFQYFLEATAPGTAQ